MGPRWAPCWPHEPCYQGLLVLVVCGRTMFRENSGFIHSPNYPGQYPYGVHCVYIIYRYSSAPTLLRSTRFQLEYQSYCFYDYIKVCLLCRMTIFQRQDSLILSVERFGLSRHLGSFTFALTHRDHQTFSTLIKFQTPTLSYISRPTEIYIYICKGTETSFLYHVNRLLVRYYQTWRLKSLCNCSELWQQPWCKICQ